MHKVSHRVAAVANSNRRNNSIEALAMGGSSSSNQCVIREHIVQYYDSCS
jgi:hypothetical protein